MYCDSHLHTDFSSDADTAPERQLSGAIAAGIPSLCITDHQDFDFPPGPLSFTFDTEAYFSALMPLKERYADQLLLRIGVELGIQPHLGPMLEEYIKKYPFDYLIGSTHLVKRVDPYEEVYFEGRSEEEAYREYFEEVYQNLLAFSDFDALGHLDYVVRYGKSKGAAYHWEDYQELIDEILKLIIRRDIALECNTAGYKAGLSHPNPAPGILLRYRELGGEAITLGSDAHRPEHLAYDFARVAALLKSCGFHEYVLFTRRRPQLLPL